MEKIPSADARVLRDLARQVGERARDCETRERRELWRAHNDLEGTRPLVLCDPENSWAEIIPEDELVCACAPARAWERRLRKLLFWGCDMGDDRVLEPVFDIMVSAEVDDFGARETRRQTDSAGSIVWTSPLASYADMASLHQPTISVDVEETERRYEAAREIFDGILDVQIKNYWWWGLGITYPFVLLRGLENMMYDFYDEPEGVHALMRFISDCWMKKLDELESRGLLSLNSRGDFIGSHSHGYTNDLPAPSHGRVAPMNMWGFGESQETVSVSANMFEEFVFQYQLPILSRFGLNYYGCCEPLHDRMHIISRIPRLRKVSVSPWADRERMAEALGRKYVYCWKPNPAPVTVKNPDWDAIRADIRATLEIARGCEIEIVLKDLHTLSNQPQNARRFCRIAKEEAMAAK